MVVFLGGGKCLFYWHGFPKRAPIGALAERLSAANHLPNAHPVPPCFRAPRAGRPYGLIKLFYLGRGRFEGGS